MDKVQKPSNSECYTPSSEPFRIYLNFSHLEIKSVNRSLTIEKADMLNNNFLNSVTIQEPVQRWSSKCKDRACDNVLPGQGYRTLQGAVIDECGAMVEW
jgi:hypothetical protein